MRSEQHLGPVRPTRLRTASNDAIDELVEDEDGRQDVHSDAAHQSHSGGTIGKTNEGGMPTEGDIVASSHSAPWVIGFTATFRCAPRFGNARWALKELAQPDR